MNSRTKINLALSVDSNILRADPTTLKNKFMVGYQGWFYCHDDGEPVGPGHHGWIHWFTYPVPDGGSPNIDFWPDTSQYTQEELFVAPGFKHKDGKQAHLFSSRNPKTVQKSGAHVTFITRAGLIAPCRHFHWMAHNGVDGVFLQRFLGLCDIASGGNDGNRRIRDEIGEHVKNAAEREGRVYAIMYDISGVQPDRVQEIIEADWYHLLQEQRFLLSPNYLREGGKPVIAIWGFGFKDSKHTPAQMRALTTFFRNSTPGGAYLLGGAPAHWRTSDSDADSNPEFVTAWMQSFDAISPWTVGRYSDQKSADAFAEDRIQGDVMFLAKWTMTRGKRVDYVPVVHPGGSGFNMSNGNWARNGAPREGGQFLWRQIYNARKWGARIMYGAMWDEYDEGTQFLPAITKSEDLPHDENHKFTLVAYDVDGYDVPADWYMRIAGYGSELVKGERHLEDRFPEKELRDWEYSHPKTEIRPSLESLLASGSGTNVGGSSSSGGGGQSYEDWLKAEGQGKDKEEAPPPPYSLEAEESTRLQSVTAQGPPTPIATRPAPPHTHSQPPSLAPPRHHSPSGLSTPSRNDAGAAPPVPLSSRPTSIATSPGPSQSPSLGEHGPSQSGHHGQATSSNLAASQPVPLRSSYPGQHAQVPQPPSQHSQDTSVKSSSYTRPVVQLPTPSFAPLPQPTSPWSSQPSAAPMWPPQDWNYSSQPLPPSRFPIPPTQTQYGYPSEYGESIAFPEAMRPVGPVDYGHTMPQATPMLEPQQLNPGPPPPLQPRESRNRASPGDYYTSILNNWLGTDQCARPTQYPNRTHSATPAASPQQYTSFPAADAPYFKSSLLSPWGFPPPPTRVHPNASPSPPQAPGQDLPARAMNLARGVTDKVLSSGMGSESGSGNTGGDTTRRESIVKRGLGSVSAAGSKVFNKFTR
ncbi:hypothetical protein EI94DRAFT_1889880 [Lactarius quietus]|nr:hypothetical protein EI94DRAFT_1889880 [Lactarius quietus]